MPATRWKPNVTVAAVIERDGRFLLVEERSGGRLLLNQPAGHLEARESLCDAIRREVREETGYGFEPRALVGIFRYPSPERSVTYLRFCFAGHATATPQAPIPDTAIAGLVWLDADELAAARERHRSPLVWRAVAEYRAGRRCDLGLLHDVSPGS